MDEVRVAVATITLARTAEEERVLTAATAALAGVGLPIFVADGGSSRAFLDHLAGFEMVAPDTPGLVGQARAAIRAAAASGATHVLYTEPDKQAFFERHLAAFAARAGSPALVIAARDAGSFATFPPTQRRTETAINDLAGRELGLDADLCYGPLLMRSDVVPLLDRMDAGLGWGWRFALMAAVARRGLAVVIHEADLPCPVDQREDTPAERLHRMRQLAQNLEGTIQGLTSRVDEA